jgi:transposase
VILDALGNPLRLILTRGQVYDITQAEALLASIEPKALLADKGYDADHFADSLTARAIKVVISPKSNWKVKRDCDFALCCERNLVERFFCTIKHFRRSRRAMRRQREASWPDYIWSARWFGLNDDRPSSNLPPAAHCTFFSIWSSAYGACLSPLPAAP